MPRRISLTNILNQIKSQRSDHGYKPLSSGENQEFFLNLSVTKEIFDGYKQSQNTNEFNDIFENTKKSYQCPTRRMSSGDSREKFELVYEIHQGFTSEQILIIENALQIVINRLFKSEILENMYKICNKSGCCLTDHVWAQSNLTNNTFYKDKYLLLKYQLMALKIKSQNGELPTINIYPSNEGNENCPTGVSCISHGSTCFIDGEFEIDLNQHQLNGSDQNNSNSLFWAGIIVYDLLRNLGHRSNDISNSNQSQIDIFKNCFLYDGNYLPNKTK